MNETIVYEKMLCNMGINPEDIEGIKQEEHKALFDFLTEAGIHREINKYRVDVDAVGFWTMYCKMKKHINHGQHHAPSDYDRRMIEEIYIQDKLAEFREKRIEKTAI